MDRRRRPRRCSCGLAGRLGSGGRAMNGRRTDDEVREIGFRALREALGVDDGVRFLRLYTESEAGDYTKERELIIGGITLDEWLSEVNEKPRQPEPDPATT